MTYLMRLRDGFVDAHRHKETLAWGIAAFYVIATLQLASFVNGRSSFLSTTGETAFRSALAAAFLVVTATVTTYQRRQFNLRHYYVRMSLVLETLVTDCLAGELEDLSEGLALHRPPMAAPPASPAAEGLPRSWPTSVWDFLFPSQIRIAGSVDTTVTPRMLGSYPALVVSRALQQERENPGDSRIYDLPYHLTLLVGIAGFFGIFFIG